MKNMNTAYARIAEQRDAIATETAEIERLSSISPSDNAGEIRKAMRRRATAVRRLRVAEDAIITRKQVAR